MSEFEIMSDRDLSDYIDEFRAGDVVRAVVFAIDIEQEQLSVSFRRYRLPRQNRGLELVGNKFGLYTTLYLWNPLFTL